MNWLTQKRPEDYMYCSLYKRQINKSEFSKEIKERVDNCDIHCLTTSDLKILDQLQSEKDRLEEKYVEENLPMINSYELDFFIAIINVFKWNSTQSLMTARYSLIEYIKDKDLSLTYEEMNRIIYYNSVLDEMDRYLRNNNEQEMSQGNRHLNDEKLLDAYWFIHNHTIFKSEDFKELEQYSILHTFIQDQINFKPELNKRFKCKQKVYGVATEAMHMVRTTFKNNTYIIVEINEDEIVLKRECNHNEELVIQSGLLTRKYFEYINE